MFRVTTEKAEKAFGKWKRCRKKLSIPFAGNDVGRASEDTFLGVFGEGPGDGLFITFKRQMFSHKSQPKLRR